MTKFMNLQTSNQTVVEVAYRYSDKTRERIHTLRKEQWTIIITAIMFGLTFNLVSHFIGSFYDDTIEFVTLSYRGMVAFAAIIFTGILMMFLIKGDLGDECRKESQIQMSFFFNKDSGKPYAVLNYIPAARLAIEFEKSHDKQKENLTRLVKDASATRNITNLIPLLEFLTIYEITHRQIPITGESVLSPIKDKIRLKTPPLAGHLRAYDFKIPGVFSLDYKQHANGGRIDITWRNGYHGKMSIDFEFNLGFRYLRDKDLTLTPKPGLFLQLFELIVIINLKSEFSPLKLLLKKSNTEGLITWTNHLSDRLVKTTDWNHFIQPIEQFVEQTYSSIPLFEANE